jgi:hypothetical protein
LHEGVFINEVMYHPHRNLGEPNDYQWIELYNATDERREVTGWRLNGFRFPPSRIAPHGFLIVARQDLSDPDGDGAYYSVYYNRTNGFPHHQATILDAENYDFGLMAPGRVTVVLRDGDGCIQDRMSYDRSMGGDGDGPSLEKVLPFGREEDSFWRPSISPWRAGSAALQNSVAAVHLRVEQERQEYHVGERLQLRTTIANRSAYPVAGFLQTRAIAPNDSEFTIVGGLPFNVDPGSIDTLDQGWIIPDSTTVGDWLLKQVSRTSNESVAPEIVEFTLGSVEGTPGKDGCSESDATAP